MRSMLLVAGVTILVIAVVEAFVLARRASDPDDGETLRGIAAVTTVAGVFVFTVGLVWP